MSLLSKSETDTMDGNVYPEHYWQSRRWFRAISDELGFDLREYPIELAEGAEPVLIPADVTEDPRLTIDVATRHLGDAFPTLVLTSGLHGVEGFLGGAVLHACLQQWSQRELPGECNFVLIHALNPHGFALQRRFDSANIDPNRNFIGAGHTYSGVAPLYRQMDSFLNPRRPNWFARSYWLRGGATLLRHGFKALSAAIAQGQYEFPRGLFFGGHGPGETQRVLDSHFEEWIPGTGPVLHLDFHSGLGRFGQLNFLMEQPLRRAQIEWLGRNFGDDRVQRVEQGRHLYEAVGSFGEWCVNRHPQRDYIFMCAEVGTYPASIVLRGLRDENSSTQWNKQHLLRDERELWKHRDRLKELFCPASDVWRTTVLEQCLDAIQNGLKGLSEFSQAASA